MGDIYPPYLFYPREIMTIVGTIPKEIYYLTSGKSTISYTLHNYNEIIKKEYECQHAVVVDSLLSAEAVSFKHVYNKLNMPVVETVQNNVPLSNLKIVGLLDGSGKNRYQALIGEYLIELQEDVLMDTILSTGIDAGGNISAQFIWGKFGGTLKLIRVGSNLYYDLQESHKRKNLPKIKDRQLEVGGIYRTRNGTTQVFLGNISSTRYIYDNRDKNYFNYQFVFENKLMLFAEMPRPYRKQLNVKELIALSREDWDNLSQFWFTTKSNNSFIEKIGNIFIPDNIISKVRSYYKSTSAQILSKSSPKTDPFAANSSMQASREISYNSIYLNMYPYNSQNDKPELFDPKKYLLFT